MTKNRKSRYDKDQLENDLEDGVESVNTDDGTIGNDPILGGPQTTSSLSLSLETWATVSADPSIVMLEMRVETDGTSDGDATVGVDESGGTSSDYFIKAAYADSDAGAGVQSQETSLIYVPAGGQIKIFNNSDPNGNNIIQTVRVAEL